MGAGDKPLAEALLFSSIEAGDHATLDPGDDPPRLRDDVPAFLGGVDFQDPAIAGTWLSSHPAPALEGEQDLIRCLLSEHARARQFAARQSRQARDDVERRVLR